MKRTLLSGALGALGIVSQAAEKPNILYIFTDQQTATAMSCAGNPDIKTPNMDRLAKEGMRFENAYCSAPLSTPSRASMFTGMTPGETNNLKNGSSVPEQYRDKTLGSLIQNAGYDCAYAGKWHVPESDIPDDIYGFKSIHPHNDYGLAETVSNYLKNTSGDKPFFVVASFDNPHNICEYARDQNLPFATLVEPRIEDCPNLPENFAKNPYDADVVAFEQASNYKVYPVANYTANDWRRYRNAYFRLVEHIDAEIGKIFKTMDDQKLWDNTIVIFTSDHGDGMGAHGWNQKSALYEEAANIPFIVRMPKGENGGRVMTQLMNNGVDLMPTLCEFATVPVPDFCKGKSFKQVFEGKNNAPVRDYTVSETQFDNSTTKGWMVRTPHYTYINYDKGKNREQLHDMVNDRGQMINLAVQAKYKDVLEAHRQLLKEWHKENNVPTDMRATPK